jgi:hypothetical protein
MELRIKQGRYLSADGINLVAGKSNDTTVGLEITEERKQKLLEDFPELFEEIDGALDLSHLSLPELVDKLTSAVLEFAPDADKAPKAEKKPAKK